MLKRWTPSVCACSTASLVFAGAYWLSNKLTSLRDDVDSRLHSRAAAALTTVTVQDGRVVTEEKGLLLVMTSGLAPDALSQVALADVKSRKPFNVSMMPPGLINGLNKDELLDLVAYALSSGNPRDAAFAK